MNMLDLNIEAVATQPCNLSQRARDHGNGSKAVQKKLNTSNRVREQQKKNKKTENTAQVQDGKQQDNP